MYEGDRSRKVTLVDHSLELPFCFLDMGRSDLANLSVFGLLRLCNPGDYEETVASNRLNDYSSNGLLDPKD